MQTTEEDIFEFEDWVNSKFVCKGNLPQVRVIHWNCPNNDKTGHLYIHVEKKVFYCHKCGYKGSGPKLVADFDGIPYRKALKLVGLSGKPKLGLEKDVSAFIEDVLGLYKDTPVEEKPLVPVSLPEAFLTVKAGETPPWIENYIRKRKFDVDLLRSYGVGYTWSGPYSYRLIIPMYEDGVLVYWVARDVTGTNKIRYVNPEVEKNGIVFNIDRAKNSKTVIINEGVFDAIRTGPDAVAILGKDISKRQTAKIIQNFESAIVMLDSEAAEEARKIAEKLSAFMDVKLVFLESGDPGETSHEVLREVINRARPLTLDVDHEVLLQRLGL